MHHALITLRLVCASSSWRWGHSSGPCRAVCCDCAQVQSISAILNMDRDHRHRGDGSGQGNWCRVNKGIFLPFRRLVVFFFFFFVCALDFLAVLLKMMCIRQGKVTILSRTPNSQQFSAPMNPLELLALFWRFCEPDVPGGTHLKGC